MMAKNEINDIEGNDFGVAASDDPKEETGHKTRRWVPMGDPTKVYEDSHTGKGAFRYQFLRVGWVRAPWTVRHG